MFVVKTIWGIHWNIIKNILAACRKFWWWNHLTTNRSNKKNCFAIKFCLTRPEIARQHQRFKADVLVSREKSRILFTLRLELCSQTVIYLTFLCSTWSFRTAAISFPSKTRNGSKREATNDRMNKFVLLSNSLYPFLSILSLSAVAAM